MEDSYKTPLQPTTANLNTDNGSPMTALVMTALHLRIVEFKFMHNLKLVTDFWIQRLFLT